MSDPSPGRLRHARRKDVPALAAIEARVHLAPWNADQFVECLDAGHEIWVIEDPAGGGLQAYAVVAVVLDEAGLLNLAVDAPWQGRGCGRALLDFTLRHMLEQGVRRMFLEVRPSNTRAIALYESCGFRRIGRRKGYYSGPGAAEDALVYSVELA